LLYCIQVSGLGYQNGHQDLVTDVLYTDRQVSGASFK